MKTTRSLLAIATIVASFASATQAATTYVITGQLTGNSVGVIYTPTNPVFTGNMTLDSAAAQLSAGVFQFEPYSDYVPWQNATYTVPDETIAYGASTGNWSGSTLHLSTNYINYQPGSTCTGNFCPPSLDNSIGALTLDLIFSDANHFTGVATATDATYSYSRSYAFSGTAVPVPATAWLFGSGLIGLGCAAQRKFKTA